VLYRATPTRMAARTAPVLTPIIRPIDYTDDGLQRLTRAVESFAYNYDLVGNRTGVTVDGIAVLLTPTTGRPATVMMQPII
jgi:hypothetical protein